MALATSKMDTQSLNMNGPKSSMGSKPSSLRIPKLKRQQRHISLSDIIAATIGEDARCGDVGYEDFDHDNLSERYNDNDSQGSFYTSESSDNIQTNSSSIDKVYNLDSKFHENFTSRNEVGTSDFMQSLFLENSNIIDLCEDNNPTDFCDNTLQAKSCHVLEEDSNSSTSQSSQSLFQVPDRATNQDSNTTDSFFKDSMCIGQQIDTPKKLDFSDMNFDFDSTIGFHSSYDLTNTMASQSNMCSATDRGKTAMSSLQVVPECQEATYNTKTNQNDASKEGEINTSYDSDLEDSVHFVEPEDTSTQPDPLQQFGMMQNDESLQPRKRRRSEIGLRTMNQSEFELDILGDISSAYQLKNCQAKGIHRARSFSGNLPHRNASRYTSMSKMSNLKSIKTPVLNRTRSFSGSTQYDCYSPIDEERFNTSLNSILGSPSDNNNSLTENPFFDDLKSTLFQDCVSVDCPQTLFETLSSGPKNDVYARERNLLSKFSTLQAKYPNEIKEISAFYRTQSAEVETERIQELHDENLPTSFRNHLNQYYDDMLHMIMERVERSLQLLTVAKREIVTANRSSMRPRPLLSRKAVSMMEEWYTRNYEHPYPSQTAVEALAKAGEINPEQVKKWFANKRNRSKNTLHMTEIANRKRKRQFSSRW